MDDIDILILLILAGFVGLFWRLLRPVKITPPYVIVYLVSVLVMSPVVYFIWRLFDATVQFWIVSVFVAIAFNPISYAIYDTLGPKRAAWKLDHH